MTGVPIAFILSAPAIMFESRIVPMKRPDAALVAVGMLLPMSLMPAAAAPTQQGRWPIEGPVRPPLKALQVPTMLEAVDQSLTAMLNSGGRVVTATIGSDGPVVTLTHRGRTILCVVAAQDPTTDQNVATSECHRMN